MTEFYADDAYRLHPLKRLAPGENYDVCRGEVSEGKVYVVCKLCTRYREADKSCNKRYCPKCQLKQAFRLYHVHYNSLVRALNGEIERYRRLIMVTLTGFRVSFDELGKKLKEFLKVAREFLKRLTVERSVNGKNEVVSLYEGGIVVGEYTRPQDGEDGYYIHCHALVHGDYYKQSIMQKDWYDALAPIFGEDLVKAGWERQERIVWLQDAMRDPSGKPRSPEQALQASLYYVLKYVTKGGSVLREEDAEQVKRIRHVSAFGEFYDNMEMAKVKYQCKACGGDLMICKQDFIDMIESGKMGPAESWKDATDQNGNVIGQYKDPLELVRAISFEPKTRKRLRDLKKKVLDHLSIYGGKKRRKRFRTMAGIFKNPEQYLLDSYGKFAS
jgi:hypothetical protein